MQDIARATLHHVTGGNNPYVVILTAFTNRPPASGSAASNPGTRPLPPNWNVRPGAGAYGEGWGEDNNGHG